MHAYVHLVYGEPPCSSRDVVIVRTVPFSSIDDRTFWGADSLLESLD